MWTDFGDRQRSDRRAGRHGPDRGVGEHSDPEAAAVGDCLAGVAIKLWGDLWRKKEAAEAALAGAREAARREFQAELASLKQKVHRRDRRIEALERELDEALNRERLYMAGARERF